MGVLPLTSEQCIDLWVARPSLWVEGFTLCRLRVAMRCVDRLYFATKDRIGHQEFPLYVVRALERRRDAGHLHPLHWEMLAVAKNWGTDVRRWHMYAQILRFRATRSIHKVRYGGRR